MSQKETLQQDKCDHITKVVKWGYNLIDGDMISYVGLYGCTECDETSETPFVSDDFKAIDHTKCGGPFECFGCKAKGLQLNAGDSTRDISDKKWTSELQSYRDARAQGMQPGGTSRAHVEAAYKASATLGKAYNSETMPKAKQQEKPVRSLDLELMSVQTCSAVKKISKLDSLSAPLYRVAVTMTRLVSK